MAGLFKNFAKAYWGDIVLWPMIFSFFVVIRIDTLVWHFGTVTITAVFALPFIPMFFIALYQLCVKKMYPLRIVFYIVAALAICLGAYSTNWGAWHLLPLLSQLVFSIASVLSTARVIIWLYKCHQAKKAGGAQDEDS